jgi:hypothetical protein
MFGKKDKPSRRDAVAKAVESHRKHLEAPAEALPASPAQPTPPTPPSVPVVTTPEAPAVAVPAAGPLPTKGRTVLYLPTPTERLEVAARRRRAPVSAARKLGVQGHAGRVPDEGEVFPLVVTGSPAPGQVEGQVVLPGTDQLYVPAAAEGEGPGCWRWPPRA